MKIPLRYQMTEFDCGPTAVANAISFLYDTEEVPPDFVKVIYQYTLDECNAKGAPYRMGTSPCSLAFLAEWFNRYGKRVGFPIRCEYYDKDQVSFREGSPVMEGLRNGAAAVMKCMFGCEQYITVTGMDDTYVHVFDPYFSNLRKKKIKEEFGVGRIEVVKDKPMEMNRLIPIEVMDCSGVQGHSYCMQECEKRIALLFFKTKPWANVPLK